ncbi:putative lipoprotein YiaD precursor [Pseudovibrio axinellae]|uniref:Putative lipoprotein YiaD n=1 Tax=Pseudovibrio axinellae TaxID=989403 RepID=A0A165UML7_9HYPH|nr:type IVB secretion system protein IcmH/DotU [Pseudovibrio axinellae]KZL12565.1 putative lipoprotein YiaD precursor [Pseudovibrio axinellae]SEP66619.1 type VI secretion system protein ImpK [Pseudovibrio axinellae]
MMAKKDFTALSVDSIDTVISTDAPDQRQDDIDSSNLTFHQPTDFWFLGADDIQFAPIGNNPLVMAASSLLALAARLRNHAQHRDVSVLRSHVISEIRAFEHNAMLSGFSSKTVRIARYVICATLDDIILNTPWGSRSIWATQSLVSNFHKDVSGGDRFYDLLRKTQANPSRDKDHLELLYLCISLGFEGRLRIMPQGTNTMSRLRYGISRLIRSLRGDRETDLSPHWRGVEDAYRPLRWSMPVWGTFFGTALIALLIYSVLAFWLTEKSEKIAFRYESLVNTSPIDLTHQPAPPRSALPNLPQTQATPAQATPGHSLSAFQAISGFLAPEIRQGLVIVMNANGKVIIRLTGAGMFATARDTLTARFVPVVNRVAAALNTQPGTINVVGYSDNIPIRNARFPNNVSLSRARAHSVADLIKTQLLNKARINAIGRGAADPIASNATANGRAQNRRIDITLAPPNAGGPN